MTAPDAVNVAGQPSRVGGGVAKVFGWLILLGGLFVALLIGSIFQAIFTGGIVGWVLGVPIALLAAIFGGGLLFGGRQLRKKGEDRSRDTRERAILSLAARQRGVLSAVDVARSLQIPEGEADAVLTEMAKRPDGRVSLEVDDNGGISFMFHEILAASGKRIEVEPPRPRVATPQVPWQPSRVVDAELIEEPEPEVARPVRHVSR